MKRSAQIVFIALHGFWLKYGFKHFALLKHAVTDPEIRD